MTDIPKTTQRKEWHRWLATSLIMAAVSTVVAFLLCEAGLRMFYPQNLTVWYKTRDDLTIHRPNHRGIFRGIETVQTYETNSFGMRDYPHELVKQDGTFRILLLGDSFMEALQVPFYGSFPHLLEARLKEMTGRPIEVINAGVAGWGTDDELTYLIRYGTAFKPDLVLVGMTLHNDIYDNLEQNYHTFKENRLVEKPIADIPAVAYNLWQVRAYLGAHSHLYQLFRTWWHSEETNEQGRRLSDQVSQLLRIEPTKTIEFGWQLTFSLFRNIQEVAAQNRARSMIFLIPLAIQIEEDRRALFLVNQHLSVEMVELDRPQRMMKTFGQTNQLPVIDLQPDFRRWMSEGGTILYLKQDGHWTEAGHRLAAELVAKILADQVPAHATSTSGLSSPHSLGDTHHK